VSLARTFKAVAWSFFGVRKGSEHERDVAELKPQQVIVVGVICAALFVALLLAIVNWVIGSGVAAG
jgi:Protein of unknown function (DUF2970)